MRTNLHNYFFGKIEHHDKPVILFLSTAQYKVMPPGKRQKLVIQLL